MKLSTGVSVAATLVTIAVVTASPAAAASKWTPPLSDAQFKWVFGSALIIIAVLSAVIVVCYVIKDRRAGRR